MNSSAKHEFPLLNLPSIVLLFSLYNSVAHISAASNFPLSATSLSGLDYLCRAQSCRIRESLISLKLHVQAIFIFSLVTYLSNPSSVPWSLIKKRYLLAISFSLGLQCWSKASINSCTVLLYSPDEPSKVSHNSTSFSYQIEEQFLLCSFRCLRQSQIKRAEIPLSMPSMSLPDCSIPASMSEVVLIRVCRPSCSFHQGTLLC